MTGVRFSVVIATKGRPDDLRETLESVSRLNPAPHEVIVVDGDEERSAEQVTSCLLYTSPSPRD